MREDHYLQVQTEPAGTDIIGALKRRKWLVLLVMIVCLTCGFLAKRIMTPLWRADAQLVMVTRTGSMRGGANDQSYQAPEAETVETQIGMLQTAELVQRTEDWLKNRALLTGQDQTTAVMRPEELQRAITVSNPKGSTLINVEVDAKSRDQALIVANGVLQSFVQWKKELAQADVQKTLTTLQGQTEVARVRMERALQKQLAYQKTHKVIDASEQARVMIDQMQAKSADISNIQEELQAEQAQTAALAGQLKTANNGIKLSGGGRNDTLTSTLQAQLNDLQIQRNLAAQKVTPLYPGILPQLDSQIKDVQKRLNKLTGDAQNGSVPSLPTQAALLQSYQQAQIVQGATQAKLEAAIQARNAIAETMNALPQTGSEINNLTRQSDDAIARYHGLQTSLDSARLEENRLNGDVQISQSAIASDLPFKPNALQNILISAFLGACLSLGLALLVDNTNRRMRSEDQVERLNTGPILGALPQLSRAALALLDRKQLPVPVAEAYSLMGANLLRVLGPSRPGEGRVVMITSAQAGEGKSMTAAELARSLARSGKRVILVDSDMRRPMLNTLFDNERGVGLVEVLSGKALLDDALVPSETPNLSILFGSKAKVNSADVLASVHMTSFLKTVRAYSDIIILDAPSCTVVDPLLLAPSVDFVLQVINLGKAEENAVYSTVSALVGLAPLGFFINRTSKENAPAYEVARSFAATQYRPELTTTAQPESFSADRTLMMFRNTSGYSAGHLNGTDNPLDAPELEAHDLTLPLKNREDH